MQTVSELRVTEFLKYLRSDNNIILTNPHLLNIVSKSFLLYAFTHILALLGTFSIKL